MTHSIVIKKHSGELSQDGVDQAETRISQMKISSL
jgi:hypothetical protein